MRDTFYFTLPRSTDISILFRLLQSPYFKEFIVNLVFSKFTSNKILVQQSFYSSLYWAGCQFIGFQESGRSYFPCFSFFANGKQYLLLFGRKLIKKRGISKIQLRLNVFDRYAHFVCRTNFTCSCHCIQWVGDELNIPCNALKTFIYVLNSFFCNVFIGYEEMFPNKLCVSSYVYWM